MARGNAIPLDPVTTKAFADAGLMNGTTHCCIVKAVDTATNELGPSNEASATPQGAATGGHNRLSATVFAKGTVPSSGLVNRERRGRPRSLPQPHHGSVVSREVQANVDLEQ